MKSHIRTRLIKILSVVQVSSSSSSSSSSSNGVPRRPSLPDPYGTSDREGTARRNWHGWTSGARMVWLPLVSRAERARPASDEFLAFCCFGPDKGPSRRQWRLAQRRKGRSRAIQSLIQSVRHTLPKHSYLTHACARVTQVPSIFHGCSSEREQQREAVSVRRAGDGAGGGSERRAAAARRAASKRGSADGASRSARATGNGWRRGELIDNWRSAKRAGVEP